MYGVKDRVSKNVHLKFVNLIKYFHTIHNIH